MVHLRLNDPDTARNPHINFVHALPDLPDSEEAYKRLMQIAALFKPVMTEMHLTVNSLVEFEYNREFAGRNWNAGETIELVLRNANGQFRPLRTVTYVMSHELAHIMHMNHLRPHTLLTQEIQGKVQALMAKGYFGDGFWSAGYRLLDGSELHTDEATVMHELAGQATGSLCGGARKGIWKNWSKGKKRAAEGNGGGGAEPGSSASGSSGRRGFQGPTLRTGAQTAKNTDKLASKRVRRSLPGEGRRVDGADPQGDSKSAYSSKFKRTQSDKARSERLQATERRLAVAASFVPLATLDELGDQDPNTVSLNRPSATDKSQGEAKEIRRTRSNQEPALSRTPKAPGRQGPAEVISLVDSDDDDISSL